MAYSAFSFSVNEELVITQSSHGFSKDEWVRFDQSGGNWAKGDNTTEAKSQVLGMVVEDIDSNTFRLQLNGVVDDVSQTLTPGAQYYLDSSAGAMTSTKPTSDIIRPIFIATDTHEGVILNQRSARDVADFESDSLSTGALRVSVSGSLKTIQNSDPLTSIDGLTTAADKMIYTTASDTYAVTDLTALARTLFAESTAENWMADLMDGTSLPTIATVAGADKVTAQDADDSSVFKTMTLNQIASFVSSGGGAAPDDATYIVQTSNGTLTNEQAMGSLATGIVKNTTTTGVQSIAAEGTDYYGPGGTDVAISDGGTGASTDSGARTNLGLEIGTDVQAYDATLQSLSGLGTAANKMAYTTGVDTWAETDITALSRTLLAETNAEDWVHDLFDGSSFTAATVAGSDKILGQDADDTDILKTFTAQSIADLAGGGTGGASTALDNLASVAINESLISDTDVTDDLGSESIRWNNLYAQAIRTSQTGTQTTLLQAYDTSGASFTTFATLTAGNPPTFNLEDGVTAVTQTANDNSTKVATTEYVDNQVSSSGAAPDDATYIVQTSNGTLTNEQALDNLTDGALTNSSGVLSQDAQLTDLSSRWTVASSGTPSSIQLQEDSDNGSSWLALSAPDALPFSSTITLPSSGNGFWHMNGSGAVDTTSFSSTFEDVKYESIQQIFFPIALDAGTSDTISYGSLHNPRSSGSSSTTVLNRHFYNLGTGGTGNSGGFSVSDDTLYCFPVLLPYGSYDAVIVDVQTADSSGTADLEMCIFHPYWSSTNDRFFDENIISTVTESNISTTGEKTFSFTAEILSGWVWVIFRPDNIGNTLALGESSNTYPDQVQNIFGGSASDGSRNVAYGHSVNSQSAMPTTQGAAIAPSGLITNPVGIAIRHE